MTETYTQTMMEDAVASADDFLQRERGASLDGGFASGQVAQHIMTVAERAANLLTSVRHPRQPSLFVPLSKHNATKYDEATVALPGHLVLVPSPLVGAREEGFCPAVVSEDSIAAGALRLHVLHQPYRMQGLGASAATFLSAAGQSETKGVGEHGRTTELSVEAEHFSTMLVGGGHANHQWRKQPDNSVSSQLAQRVLGQDAQQSTVTITRKQIAEGQAALFWHESMRDEAGNPESATREGALVILQALGYQALTPTRADSAKRSLA